MDTVGYGVGGFEIWRLWVPPAPEDVLSLSYTSRSHKRERRNILRAVFPNAALDDVFPTPARLLAHGTPVLGYNNP